MNTHSSLHRLTLAGLIAALYTALTLLLPIASFGPVQLRFSEMLTILPIFSKTAIPGLTLGCAIANAVGMAMGANIAGAWDILFGTLATFLAAVSTYALRNVRIKGFPVLAALPPVLFNAGIIGCELSLVLFGKFDAWPFLITAAQVGAGQLVPCIIGGLLLFKLLQKAGWERKFD